jgi:hypothetical protein
MTAAIAFSITNPSRRTVGFGPCLFRGTGFDQKKSLVVDCAVFLSYPPDHSVLHINRIQSHLLSFFHATLLSGLVTDLLIFMLR